MNSISRIKSEIIKFIIYKKNFSNVETILLCYKFQGFPVSLLSSPGSRINIQITTSSVNFIKFNISKFFQEIRDHKTIFIGSCCINYHFIEIIITKSQEGTKMRSKYSKHPLCPEI